MSDIEYYRLVDNVADGCNGCCLHYERVENGDGKAALLRLVQWAEEHGYSLATGPDDLDADAVIQTLTPVQKGRAQ